MIEQFLGRELGLPTPTANDSGLIQNGDKNRLEVTANGVPTDSDGALKSELQILFGKLLGSDLTNTNNTSTFLELGFDSLMLTQASRSVEKQFGVRIPFGQLLAQCSTFQLLAATIEMKRTGPGDVMDLHPKTNGTPTGSHANGLVLNQ